MNDEISLCVHCGDEIRIIPDSSGRLLKCDIAKTHIITEAGELKIGFRHHSITCSERLKAGKAANDGSS